MKNLTFDRFVVEIERAEGDTYRARVGSKWECLGPWIEEPADASKEPLGPTRDLAAKTMSLGAAEPGKRLFEWAFVGSVLGAWIDALARAEALDRGVTLCLQLDNAPQLASLPWEAMRDARSHGYLAQDPRIVIARILGNSNARTMERRSRLSVWALLPDPPGPSKISGALEWQKIRNHLEPLEARGELQLEECSPASLETLGRKLEKSRCDVLHVVAHGKPSQDPEDMGRLGLESPDGEDETVTGLRFVRAVTRHNPPSLVVLNVCSGGVSRHDEIYDGLAQHLVHQGVGAVVAMGSVVTDQAAVAFGEALYEFLAQGLTLESAMNGAWQRLALGKNQAEWATPILFLAMDHLQLTGQIKLGFLRSRRHRPIWVGLAVAALIAGWGFLDGPWSGAAGSQAKSALAESSSGGTSTTEPSLLCPSPAALPDLKMVPIRAGFLDSEGVRTPIERGFCIGAFEVTRDQWRAVLEEEPPDRFGDRLSGLAPVSRVSFSDAHRFVAALNLGADGPFRLPNELEWEYAARAGSGSDYFFGDDPDRLDRFGNCFNFFGRDGYDGPAPVGSYPANDWGLHDVHGNLAEWVQSSDPAHPQIVKGKARRMGGSFGHREGSCAFSNANFVDPEGSGSKTESGFRIVRPLRKLDGAPNP